MIVSTQDSSENILDAGQVSLKCRNTNSQSKRGKLNDEVTTRKERRKFNLEGTAFPEISGIVRDTMVQLSNGTELQIQNLAPGDFVKTINRGPQEIKRIISRRVSGTGSSAPVLFKANESGNHKDLLVSQEHLVLIESWQLELLFGRAKALGCASHMVKSGSITIETTEFVEYFQLHFDAHALILANGAAIEGCNILEIDFHKRENKPKKCESPPNSLSDALCQTAEMVLEQEEILLLTKQLFLAIGEH